MDDSLIEKNISQLIESQFPAYYREEGQNFIQFVTEYYNWLESTSEKLGAYVSEDKFLIDVTAGSLDVVGYGTSFTSTYSAGGKIAIYTDGSDDDYQIFTIETINSDTSLTLSQSKVPTFNAIKTKHGTVVEGGNALYYSRQFTDLKDIDKTFDDFVVYFKEKYLKNIQFDTVTNTRKLVKNSLSLYRSKGTERSLDLLFRIAFGKGASVYYPGKDVFRLSSGQWYRPEYLEITTNEINRELVGKEIYGFDSGATAFVESIVRDMVFGRQLDVMFLSTIKGQFKTGELINSVDNVLDVADCPRINGSLTEVDLPVTGTGEGFKIGDQVYIGSTYGKLGLGIVRDITDATGFVNFNLLDGGYGYSTNASILVSDSVATIANTTVSNSLAVTSYFNLFDKLVQPVANISFTGSTDKFVAGQNVYAYSGSTLTGTGRVVGVNYTGFDTGSMVVGVLSGSLRQGNLHSEANGILSTILSYTDQSRVANVMGVSTTVSMQIQSANGVFGAGDQIYQMIGGNEVANAYITGFTSAGGLSGTVTVNSTQGAFRNGLQIISRSTGATANVSSVIVKAGLFNVSKPEVLSFTINTDTNNTNILTVTSGNTSALTNGSLLVYSTNNSVVRVKGSQYQANVVNSTAVQLTTNADIIVANGTTNLTFYVPNTFLISDYTTIGGENIYETTYANVTVNTALSATNIILMTSGNTTGGLIPNTTIHASTNSSVIDTTSIAKITRIINTTAFAVNTDILVSNGTSNLTFRTPNTFWVEQYGTPRAQGTIDLISLGEGANFSIANSLLYTENVDVNNLYLKDYVDVGLDEIEYGFPLDPSANLSSVISDVVQEDVNITIGRVAYLTNLNVGRDYNESPIVTLYEPYTYAYKYDDDFILSLSDAAVFEVGEIITQTSSNARALVLSQPSTTSVLVQNLRFYPNNSITLTTGTSSRISGQSSGTTSNVVTITKSPLALKIGGDATIQTETKSASGTMTKVSVVESGVGFQQGEQVYMFPQISFGVLDTSRAGYGFARLLTSGVGSGWYRKSGGFLSANKKLFDGNYWQEYSYEVRSSFALNKYSDMLREVVHVAGTKFFGRYVHDVNLPDISVAVSNVNISNTAELYTGLFPLQDYEWSLIDYLGTQLFPVEDLDLPSNYSFDCESGTANANINITNIDLFNGSNLGYDCDDVDNTLTVDLENTLRRY